MIPEVNLVSDNIMPKYTSFPSALKGIAFLSLISVYYYLSIYFTYYVLCTFNE